MNSGFKSCLILSPKTVSYEVSLQNEYVWTFYLLIPWIESKFSETFPSCLNMNEKLAVKIKSNWLWSKDAFDTSNGIGTIESVVQKAVDILPPTIGVKPWWPSVFTKREREKCIELDEVFSINASNTLRSFGIPYILFLKHCIPYIYIIIFLSEF